MVKGRGPCRRSQRPTTGPSSQARLLSFPVHLTSHLCSQTTSRDSSLSNPLRKIDRFEFDSNCFLLQEPPCHGGLTSVCRV